MTGSNWTVEDYSAWRRERVEEAVDLARYASYSDLAGAGKRQELRAMMDRVRGDDGEPGGPGWLEPVVRVVRAALFQPGLRWERRQPSSAAH